MPRNSTPRSFNGFARASDSIHRIKTGNRTRRVTLACTNAFASMWLMPRMGDFWRRFPDIMVDHLISDDGRDFRRAEVDLRIRYGFGAWPDETARLLLNDTIFPIAAPGFAARHEKATADDIPGLPLLHVDWVDPTWTGWDELLRRARVPHGPLAGRRFSSFAVTMQACCEEQGVAIGWQLMIRPLIDRGDLVPFTDLLVPVPGAYYLTWNEYRAVPRGRNVARVAGRRSLRLPPWIDAAKNSHCGCEELTCRLTLLQRNGKPGRLFKTALGQDDDGQGRHQSKECRMDGCGILDPFQCGTIPLADWLKTGLRWLVDEYRPFFQAIEYPIDQLLKALESALVSVPPIILLILFGLIAWQIGGRMLCTLVVAALIFTGFLGVWHEAMATLSIVFAALLLCTLIGVPLGIWASRSDRVYSIMRPVLDGMQTIPAFVYLVPIVMLFSIGNVSGAIVTIIFAVAPLIRLTNLGIRQVPSDVTEAMRAFGATERQLLWKAQVPLAMPTIMAGVNQTLMMSLSMVVIASMIAVGGLGAMVLQGIGRLDIGRAAVGGFGIVMLAIVLDRLTQVLSAKRGRPGTFWKQGPVGFARRQFGTARLPGSTPEPAAPTH